MQLLVIRHAIAGDRAEFARSGRPDSERPLTEDGRSKMVANAKGLQAIVPSIDLLATSPFTRAVQTAELVAEVYHGLAVELVDALAHGGAPQDVGSWLERQPANQVAAVVGHEPDLSELISWFTTGSSVSFCQLKKGGVCNLRFAGKPRKGAAELRWLLTPKVLRGLAP